MDLLCTKQYTYGTTPTFANGCKQLFQAHFCYATLDKGELAITYKL